MAIAFVQQKTGTVTTSGSTIAFDSNVSAGSLLVAHWWIQHATVVGDTPTDTRGNTWQLAVRSTVANSVARCEIWYALNANAGANTVAFPYVGGNSDGAFASIQEYSGFSAGVTPGPTNTNIDTSVGESRIAGQITTTVAASLITAMIGTEQGFTTDSRLSGWQGLTATGRADHQYKITTATETTDAAITTTGFFTRGSAAIAAFSETAPTPPTHDGYIIIRGAA